MYHCRPSECCQDMEVYIDGECPNCSQLVTERVEARIDNEKLQGRLCPHCHQAMVHFERMSVHHRSHPRKWRLLRSILTGSLLVSFVVVLSIVCYLEYQTRRSFSNEELFSAKHTAQSESCAQILREFIDKAPGGRKEVARLMKSEPSVIRRLSSSSVETIPSPAMEISIRSLYVDYKLMHDSWLLLRWKYRHARYDPYTGAINSQQEQFKEQAR